MCGLSGIMSSSLSYNEEGIFRDLLNVSSLRGSDGAGVIVSQPQLIKRTPNIRVLRTKHISGTLAYSSEMEEILKPRVNCVIGHARWPTKGGMDIKSVHPHRTEHIVGVHNGTMFRVAGEPIGDDSDSRMLFESFAKIGVEETIKTSDGAYALVWIDEKDQTVNFLRNGQRPLYFKNIGWNKNINTLYWASEKEMLDFVLKRSYKGENTWDTYLPVDTWYKYPLDVHHMIQPVSVVSNVKPAPKVYASGGAYGGGHHGRRNSPNRYTSYEAYAFSRAEDDDAPWVRDISALPDQNVILLAPPKQSKQAEKRAKKIAQKEAADELKRRARFQKANIPATSPKDIEAAMAEIVDLSDDVSDIPFSGLYVPLEGESCSWCGSVACVGDSIHLAGSDLGAARIFICDDCGRSEYCKDYIPNTRKATISPRA